jgi:hypothetical protein
MQGDRRTPILKGSAIAADPYRGRREGGGAGGGGGSRVERPGGVPPSSHSHTLRPEGSANSSRDEGSLSGARAGSESQVFNANRDRLFPDHSACTSKRS